MLSFFQTAKACYFNDEKKKICYQTNCNNIYPQSNGWSIYGCSWCPYNKKARELLDSKNIKYNYYDVEQSPFNSRDNYKKMMANYIGNHLTTPAIFKNGKLIGGYTDLAIYNF
jgi:glutaredoxin 3